MSYPKHLSDAEKEALPVLDMSKPSKVMVNTYDYDEPMWWEDSKGRQWTFGQYEPGAWYKTPSFFDLR